MTDDDTNPIITPMMSSITLFLTIVEKRKMSIVTAMAPMNAPRMTAMKPVAWNTPEVMVPPMSSITSATPRLAPPLIPKIEGPASGFLKAVWSISPLTASAPPHRQAVMACGRRVSMTM